MPEILVWQPLDRRYLFSSCHFKRLDLSAVAVIGQLDNPSMAGFELQCGIKSNISKALLPYHGYRCDSHSRCSTFIYCQGSKDLDQALLHASWSVTVPNPTCRCLLLPSTQITKYQLPFAQLNRHCLFVSGLRVAPHNWFVVGGYCTPFGKYWNKPLDDDEAKTIDYVIFEGCECCELRLRW